MATNVIRLERPNSPDDFVKTQGPVPVRSEGDILPAAQRLYSLASAYQLRPMVVGNLSSYAAICDAAGRDVNTAVFGWPKEQFGPWKNRIDAMKAPALRAVRLETEPFWFNAEGFKTKWPNQHLGTINLTQAFSEERNQAMIVVPVRLVFGQIAAVLFASKMAKKDNLSSEYANGIPALSEMGRQFMTEVSRLTESSRYSPRECYLTPCEMECLRWASFGKTDSETATIIERSHAAVRYHLQNAMQKLDAYNRTQAVFRAGQLGFLGADG